ncbi:light-regulated signal transduction histidine kinase (bacteriophytochrome) [Pseudomonas sp. PvP001]
MAINPVPLVSLANCEDEPIHRPGAIQPHGALIALDAEGRVLSRSANLMATIGLDVLPGSTPDGELLGGDVLALIAEGLASSDHWANSVESVLLGRLFDVVAHRHLQILYLEFEPRRTASGSFSQFALYAQRIISQMQNRHDIDALLSRVTQEIRNMTGYDRVMAYRFRPDLSGEVIAEAHREDLESYLGQRYPASDIPAQARLLYILNPIRLIADVTYAPAPLIPSLDPRTGQPFDLSFSTLRSVSPIHCEYLTNMGVRASMSVSIVVGGKLWGLFSCHHMSPKTMAHPLRMSFQVISQVCSALVERLEHNLATQTLKQASDQQQRLMTLARDSEDLVSALAGDPDNIASLIPCDGAAVVMSGRTQSIGGHFDALCRQVLEHVEQDPNLEVFHTEHWQGSASERNTSGYCGILAVRFHRQESGWVMWLRKEEINNVRWGGKPEKIIKVGPSGARLTPRGSFEAWEEVVRGRSASWGDTDIAIAEKLRRDLVELCLSRASEIDGMRQRLIAMLGHDLRNPAAVHFHGRRHAVFERDARHRTAQAHQPLQRSHGTADQPDPGDESPAVGSWHHGQSGRHRSVDTGGKHRPRNRRGFSRPDHRSPHRAGRTRHGRSGSLRAGHHQPAGQCSLPRHARHTGTDQLEHRTAEHAIVRAQSDHSGGARATGDAVSAVQAAQRREPAQQERPGDRTVHLPGNRGGSQRQPECGAERQCHYVQHGPTGGGVKP